MLRKPPACGNLWQPTRRKESRQIRQVFLQEKELGAKHIWVGFVLKRSGLGRRRKWGKEKGFWCQVPGVNRGTQARGFIPQPKIGKWGGKKDTLSITRGHLAAEPPAMPFLGTGRVKGTEGAAASGLCLLHGGAGLSLCSASWQGEQGRQGGSGGTFPPAGAGAGGDLRRVSGGGHCSC